MAATELDDITSTIQTFWPTLFMDDLFEDNIIVNLCNRDYIGSIGSTGDTVTINQIDNVTGETLVIDQMGGGRTFTPATMTTTGVSVTANRRFVGSVDIADLAQFQSMLLDPNSADSAAIRMKLMRAVSEQINTYIYSLVAPSVTTVAATLDASTIAGARKYGSQQLWDRTKPWYSLLGPSYWEDLLLDTTLTSGDFVNDQPVVGGQRGVRRFGFNMFEDNSAGNADRGLFFHPDFLYWVAQYEPRFKISDKHSQNEFAYVLSVDLVGGAKLGHDGAIKHTLRTLV